MKKWIYRIVLFISILVMFSGIGLNILAPKYMGLTRSLVYRNKKILDIVIFNGSQFAILGMLLFEYFLIYKIENKKIPLSIIQGINMLVVFFTYQNLSNGDFLGLPIFFIGVLIFNLYHLLTLLNHIALSKE